MGILSGKKSFHQLIKKLDVAGDCLRKLLRGKVFLRHGYAAAKFVVIKRIFRGGNAVTGKIFLLDCMPKTEEIRHIGDKGRTLGAENYRKLADGILSVFIKLHLVLHGGAVFIFKAAFKRHCKVVWGKKRNKLTVRSNRRFYRLKNIVYLSLRRGHPKIFRKDLVYKVGTVCSSAVGKKIRFSYHIIA